MRNPHGTEKETNLTINYDVLDRPEEKILVLLAFIGMPVNVTEFVSYANWKFQITDTGNWLANGSLCDDLQFVTPDNSGELSVSFTGCNRAGYSEDMLSLLKAIESSPGMYHRLHWLSTNLTIDELVNLTEFRVLNSESKLLTMQNFFGLNAAKFLANYYIRHENDLKARKMALGRFNDLHNRRRERWTPESFLSQVELQMLAHPSQRRRNPEAILAEIRETHDHLLALAMELGKV